VGSYYKKQDDYFCCKRLYMTPRDMAKIGQLALQKGKWNDEIIISKAWMTTSTSIQTKLARIDYGFL